MRTSSRASTWKRLASPARMPGKCTGSKPSSSANARTVAISPASNAPRLSSSVAASQLRNTSNCCPGAAHAFGAQRRDRGREQFQCIARRLFLPARDRQQAAGCEMRVVRAQRFDGRGVILGDRLHAGATGGEGRVLRQHDHVVAIAAGADETARVGDMHAHARVAIQVTCERGETIAQQRNPLRIHIDRVDPARTERECLQHVATAARTQHQDPRPRTQPVRQRRGGAVQVGQRRGIRMAPGDDAGAVAVDVQAELRRGFLGVRQAQAGDVAQRHARAFDHRQPAVRTVRLGDDPRIAQQQRLGQSLERVDRRRQHARCRRRHQRQQHHARTGADDAPLRAGRRQQRRDRRQHHRARQRRCRPGPATPVPTPAAHRRRRRRGRRRTAAGCRRHGARTPVRSTSRRRRTAPPGTGTARSTSPVGAGPTPVRGR